MKQSYEDILHHAYPIPTKRARMSASDRAAQFSPFAALTGYEDAIAETGRLTQKKIKLDSSVKEEMNRKIFFLAEHIGQRPEITVTYYLRDPYKKGGAYFSKTGILKKVDRYQHFLLYTDGTSILMDDIYNIEGDIFKQMESEAPDPAL